jgi:hypothetical protein
MRVLVLDPGGGTGYAFYEDGRLGYGEIHSAIRVRSFVLGLWALYPDMVVVYEDFTISARTIRTAVDYSALYVIGWLIIEAEARGHALVKQNNTHKGWADDDKLRTLGWYYPSENGHQNDAIRHLIYYLLHNERDEARQVIAPILDEL